MNKTLNSISSYKQLLTENEKKKNICLHNEASLLYNKYNGSAKKYLS